jgi:hypothetical protein
VKLMSEADEFVVLVEKCLGGKLPSIDDTSFVAAMMGAFGPTCLKGQPEPVLDSFSVGLAETITTLRVAENGLVN